MQNENVGYLSKNQSKHSVKRVSKEKALFYFLQFPQPSSSHTHKTHSPCSLEVTLLLEKLLREMDFTAHLCKECRAAKQNKQKLLSPILLLLAAHL